MLISNYPSKFTEEIFESSTEKEELIVTNPELKKINTDILHTLSVDMESTTNATAWVTFEGNRIS